MNLEFGRDFIRDIPSGHYIARTALLVMMAFLETHHTMGVMTLRKLEIFCMHSLSIWYG